MQFAIIKVNPDDWAIDLENPKKNTVQCCQMCSIQEDIKRVSNREWNDQPAPVVFMNYYSVSHLINRTSTQPVYFAILFEAIAR